MWVVKVVKRQRAKENTSPLCGHHSCEAKELERCARPGGRGGVTFQTSVKPFAAAGQTAVDRVKRGIYYKANEWRSRERRILAAAAQSDSRGGSLQLSYSPGLPRTTSAQWSLSRQESVIQKKKPKKNTACEANSVQPCVINLAWGAPPAKGASLPMA